MSAPTASVIYSSVDPAAPAGNQNVKPQSDGATPLQSISFFPQKATSSLLGVVKPDNLTCAVSSDGTLTTGGSGGVTHFEPLVDGLMDLVFDGTGDIVMVSGVPN